MFWLKIFVRVQTFRRVPPVLPRNFCHPGCIYGQLSPEWIVISIADELVDKKEETFDAGKSIPFCPDVVIVLLTAPGKVVGALHSGGDGPPLTVELLLSPFDRDEEEALSAG